MKQKQQQQQQQLQQHQHDNSNAVDKHGESKFIRSLIERSHADADGDVIDFQHISIRLEMLRAIRDCLK